MSTLNPKAKRLIEPLTCISSEGKRNLTGLLSLMVEILHPVSDDEKAGAYVYKPQKRASRNARKKAQPLQAESGVSIKEIILISLLLIGYIAANSIAPVVSTEAGTADPALSVSSF